MLGGEHRDRFVAGPLEPARYAVALQPATFDRWTWAFGTENGAEAQSVEVRSGESAALGDVEVDCGPAIRVTVDVASGRTAPDLSEVRWSRDLELEATIVTAEDLRYDIKHADLDRYSRLLMLRGLREGSVEGLVRLKHRYFVPGESVRAPFAGELERGRTIAVTLPVADVGGGIEVTDTIGTATTARLIDAEGGERAEPLREGRVDFFHLPVGPYRLQLCADATCASVEHEWQAVEVAALTTLQLRR
jgi:hypothetical protein